MLLQQAVEATTHPLAGTAAEWIWLVLALPLLGAAVNGVLAMVTEWHPGPFDPDPVHTGEHEIPQSPTLVERAERGAPRLMTVVEGHVPYHETEAGGHGDHHEAGDEAGSHAPPRRHPFLGLVSLVGTGVLAASVVVAVLAFLAMRSTHAD